MNSIKQAGDGLGLQVTKPARAADLVKDDESESTYLADCFVYCFDNAILVVDADAVTMAHRVELVTTIAQDTGSIYHGTPTSIQPQGNGYQVQLPGIAKTGLEEGDTAPATPAPGLLIITPDSATDTRLARDITTIRRDQLASS